MTCIFSHQRVINLYYPKIFLKRKGKLLKMSKNCYKLENDIVRNLKFTTKYFEFSIVYSTINF